MIRFQLQRESYRYWRGLSLARLALELSRGDRTLQLDGEPIHFADVHLYAANTAKSIADGGQITQTQEAARRGISVLLRREFDANTKHPALVVALSQRDAYTQPSTQGMMQGVRICGLLTDLDPFSQDFIKSYFGLPTLEPNGLSEPQRMERLLPSTHSLTVIDLKFPFKKVIPNQQAPKNIAQPLRIAPERGLRPDGCSAIQSPSGISGIGVSEHHGTGIANVLRSSKIPQYR